MGELQPSGSHVSPDTVQALPGSWAASAGLGGQEAEPRLGRSREPPQGEGPTGTGRSRSPARRRGEGSRDSRLGRVLSLSPPREREPPTNSARRPRGLGLPSRREPAAAQVGAARAGRGGERVGCGAGRARKLGRGRAGDRAARPSLRFLARGTVVDFLRRSRPAGVSASGAPAFLAFSSRAVLTITTELRPRLFWGAFVHSSYYFFPPFSTTLSDGGKAPRDPEPVLRT